MRKKLAIILAMILVFDIAALAVVGIDRYLSASKSSISVAEEETSLPSEEESSTQPLISKVNFAAVGDNLIHVDIYKQAAARSTNGTYDFTLAYENVADYIAASDVSILNQETIISTEHEVDTYPCFNSPAELGDEMLRIGFDVFNISTNHSLDKGESGLISTINYWKERNAITTGAYLNEEDFVIPTQTVNGITFAYLGFTDSTNGLNLPADSEVVLVRASDEALLEAKIKQAKKMADAVIVNAHWGEEYTHEPTDAQRDLAQKLCDWGADVILGTHPHVIQPVEFLTAPDGRRTLVAYSLGNFISAQNRGPRMLGGMINFNIVRNNSSGVISIEDVKFSGVVTHYASDFSNIRVYMLKDYTEELANNHGVGRYTSEFSLSYLKEMLADVIDSKFLM
ncbi:MAG: CapA family protein [Clostridia bacterium]|nr:CapA family protein [Clostridia bacterium]